jgi:KilA-N domain
MTQTITLNLGDATIRQIDGLYSLNDLHKAAGSEAKHEPNNFIRTDQVKALIIELAKSADSRINSPLNTGNFNISIKTVRGAKGGTYVCKELVYAYAMWISAAFMLTVIRAFDSWQQAAPAPAPAKCLAFDETEILRSMVNDHAARLPKPQQAKFVIQAWSKLKSHFGVAYRNIPASQFSEAISLIGRHIANHDALALPAPIAENGYIRVHRDKLSDLWTDLGKLKDRINGLGALEADLPPPWWAARRLG